MILARTSPGRAVELGRASKLLDLVWRGVVAKSPFALRIDERSGERAATVVSINADLVTALEHERWIAPLADEMRAALTLRIDAALVDAPAATGGGPCVSARRAGCPIKSAKAFSKARPGAVSARKSWEPRLTLPA